ncbi:MAG: MFS transporter [Rhodomicrobium sp.]
MTQSTFEPRQPLYRMFMGAPGRVYLLLCAMLFIEYIDRVNLSAAAPLIKAELGLSNTQLGLALSAFGYCYAAFQIVNGYLGDRFGPRLTLTLCGILWATGTLLTGFASGLTALVLARLLVGLGEAGTIPTGTRVMTNWVPKVRRGFAQGFTHSSARLAAGITPPLVVAMIPVFGWRGAFIALGAVSLAWVAAWAFYFRNDPKDHPGVTSHELAALPVYGSHGSTVPIPYKRLIVRTLPVAFVFFCHAWTLWLYLSWLPTFFTETYRVDLKASALFTSGVFLAGMVGDTVGGLLTDAIYKRTGDLNRSRRDAVIVGFAGSLLFLLPVLFVHHQLTVILALAAAFFFLEITEAPVWAVPIDIAPQFAGLAGGIMSTAAGLAATLSPFVFGIITDVTGSYRVPFILSIALMGAGIAASFLMRPDRAVLVEATVMEPTGPLPALEPKLANLKP